MSDELIFEDPPEARKGGDNAQARWVERLFDFPGRWARFDAKYKSTKSAYAAALYLNRKHAGRGLEFVARNGSVYGRCVGDAEE